VNLDMPTEQLERLQPIVEPLLGDLRRRTQDLSPHSDSALVYAVEAETGQ
jgi:hypothetical protein